MTKFPYELTVNVEIQDSLTKQFHDATLRTEMDPTTFLPSDDHYPQAFFHTGTKSSLTEFTDIFADGQLPFTAEDNRLIISLDDLIEFHNTRHGQYDTIANLVDIILQKTGYDFSDYLQLQRQPHWNYTFQQETHLDKSEQTKHFRYIITCPENKERI